MANVMSDPDCQISVGEQSVLHACANSRSGDAVPDRYSHTSEGDQDWALRPSQRTFQAHGQCQWISPIHVDKNPSREFVLEDSWRAVDHDPSEQVDWSRAGVARLNLVLVVGEQSIARAECDLCGGRDVLTRPGCPENGDRLLGTDPISTRN